jgi:predicted phage terminase large subunit-like protein
VAKWARDEITRNGVLRRVYGIEPSEPWTDTTFSVTRPASVIKDPTMRAAGLGGNIIGAGGELLIADDPIDEAATYSAADNLRAQEWFDNAFIQRVEPTGGRVVGIGSPWVEGDLYDYIVKKHRFERKQFPAADVKNVNLLPSRFPDAFLQNIRETDPYTWELKYRLNRQAQRGGWEWGWIEMFDDAPGGLRYSIGVDPALSPKGDFFALAVLGTDAGGVMYLVDLYLGHISAPQQVTLIIEKWKQWGAVSVGIEEVAYQGALKQHVQAAAPGCPCVGVPLPQTAKEIKLQSLAPLFQQKRIRVSAKLQELSSFRSQYLAFPRGNHDDALDAIWIGARGAESFGSGFYDAGFDWRR